MASNKKDMGGALDLTWEVESGEEVQAQLWIEAQKVWAVALERELRELTEANQHLDQHHLELEGRIQCLKDNHRQIMASKEWIWEQLCSGDSQ